jgi:tetratricopeptide (TPR) repeat protein
MSSSELALPPVPPEAIVDEELLPPQDWSTPLPAAPARTARKQVRIHTKRLQREQEKWQSINRTLREEQRHVEDDLRDDLRAEGTARAHRSQRSMGRHDVAEPGRYEPPLSTGLGSAHTRQRERRRRQQEQQLPSDRANPYAPVRIAEQFEQLEPAETGGTRSLDDIRERLRVQEEAATVAMERVERVQREDATSQAKQLAKQGNQALAAGDLPAATHSYQKAVAAARAAADPSLVAVLLASRAEVHFASRDYKAALADAHEAAATDPRVVDMATAELMRAAAELVEDAAAVKPTHEPASPVSEQQPQRKAAPRRGGPKQRTAVKPKPPTSERSTRGPRAGRVTRAAPKQRSRSEGHSRPRRWCPCWRRSMKNARTPRAWCQTAHGWGWSVSSTGTG